MSHRIAYARGHRMNEEVSHLHKGERETWVERRRRRQFVGVFSPSCRDQVWFKKKKM